MTETATNIARIYAMTRRINAAPLNSLRRAVLEMAFIVKQVIVWSRDQEFVGVRLLACASPKSKHLR